MDVSTRNQRHLCAPVLDVLSSPEARLGIYFRSTKNAQWGARIRTGSGVHALMSYGTSRHILFLRWMLLVACNFCNVIYLFGHFSLSHTFTDVIPENEHRLWFEYAIRHSVNISTRSALVGWVMGYLNFQIEHHLFPSMPQHKNALAAPHVRAFCERWSGSGSGAEYQLKYVELDYIEAWRKMFANLSNVGMHYYTNGIANPNPIDNKKID